MVADCWNKSYLGAPHDGNPWVSGSCYTRVLRGGSWFCSGGGVRSAYRHDKLSVAHSDEVGFRVARSVTI